MEHTEHYNLNLPDYNDQADIEKINENTRAIDSAMYGMKPKQTAVASPTSTGTAVEFINTVAQDTNGRLTNLTKKTIPTFVKSGSTAAAGLVPKPSTTAGTTKYLREDATWQVPPNTTYSAASGGGLSLYGGAFSIGNSGVDAGTYGPTGNVTGTDGTTINVPQITVNAKGQVTGVVNRVYTSKNTKNNIDKSGVDGVLGTQTSTTAPNYFYNRAGSWAIPPNTNTWRPYQTKTYTVGDSSTQIGIEANGYVNITGTMLGVSTPTGYAPVALTKLDTDSRHVYASFVDVTKTGANTVMTLKNTSSSDRTVNPSITILYVKTGSP